MTIMQDSTAGAGIQIHHVGLLVDHIETYLAGSFWSRQSPVVYDPNQKARLCLVCIAEDQDHLVELIEPAGTDSPTYRAQGKGQKLHHLCFAVPRKQVADAIIEKYRLLPVTNWQSAILFQGRPIRFAYTRNRELVEFVVDE